MNLKNLEIALTAALTAHDRAYAQLRGLMNAPASADMNTVRLNLLDAQAWIEAAKGTPA